MNYLHYASEFRVPLSILKPQPTVDYLVTFVMPRNLFYLEIIVAKLNFNRKIGVLSPFIKKHCIC